VILTLVGINVNLSIKVVNEWTYNKRYPVARGEIYVVEGCGMEEEFDDDDDNDDGLVKG
jgi:hypothetical protein